MSAYNPSKLHPGGYGAVPIALMCDQRSGKNHVAAYAAVVSAVVGKGAAAGTTGRNLTRNARLLERSGLSWHTFMEAVRDLEEWGYLERLPTPPRSPKRWRILPTPDVTSDLEAEAEADAAALDPTTTGREGGKKAQGSRDHRDTLEAENDPKALATTAIGTRDHRATVSRPPRDSLDVSLDVSLKSWLGTEAHPLLNNLAEAQKLADEYGNKVAKAALVEVDSRLRNPDEYAPVKSPYGLANHLAKHPKESDDQRGKRENIAQKKRAATARSRAIEPAQRDIDEAAELEANRKRQLALLEHLATGMDPNRIAS